MDGIHIEKWSYGYSISNHVAYEAAEYFRWLEYYSEYHWILCQHKICKR